MTDTAPEAAEADPTTAPAPKAATPRWKSPTALASASLAVAVTAVGCATAAWLKASHTAPQYSGEQIAHAKTSVCAAYVTVRQGIVENTHLSNPNPADHTAQLAVVANARLALFGGGGFLHDRLNAEPATPAELATAVGEFATTAEQLGANYAAGTDDSVQVPLRHDLDTHISQLNNLCS